MESIKEYKTKQRDILLDYVLSTNGSHFTVDNVRNYCIQKNLPIGTATIYRYLEKMVNEHMLTKYFIDEHSAACFEYVGGSEKKYSQDHFHLKCEVCGKLIHLECEELKHLKEHISQEHDFEINSFRSVFYGICSNCKKD